MSAARTPSRWGASCSGKRKRADLSAVRYPRTVTHPPAVSRVQRAWLAQAEGAREQAVVALLFATVIFGAHLARLGTIWARVTVWTALALVLLTYVALVMLRRRENQSTRLTLQRVLLATDPAIGARALRALSLVERTERDESAGSAELAKLHLSRVVDKVSSEAVKSAASRYAQRRRGVTLTLLSLVLIAVVIGPGRVAEGLDVLSARHGRAPLPMSWVSLARLSALPPSYTRETEKALVFGTSVSLPKGTVVTVRAVPRDPERPLVLTDGKKEEPFASDGSGGIVARWTLREHANLRVAARFGEVLVDDEESVVADVVPDRPPKVDLEGAPRTVRLAEVAKIDVRWSAEDDHGLREVDLVMRSGAREERRVLGRFDGESRAEHGGYVVLARDAFLRRMFLPIVITVEARDNDPLDGPKWTASHSITVIPPIVGQPEAERYAALRTLRDGLVDLLKKAENGASTSASETEVRAALSAVLDRAEAVLTGTYSGAVVPRGFRAFVKGQLDRLVETGTGNRPRRIEDAVLAVDVALAALGNRDAVDVAKRLGDVAEEAAITARVGRETEKRQEALSKLDVVLTSVEQGADRLSTLAALGQDVGSVARADAARVRRARDASDLMHAELAALHLAERLRRPMPSFGATTGHGGGVESGRAPGRPDGEGSPPSPSSADSDFDRSASSLSELARQHQSTLDGVEAALQEAENGSPNDEERKEANAKAEALRRSVDNLPLPGQEFGTPRAAAALGRELGLAAAHSLDDAAFDQAVDNTEKALSALDEADRRLGPDDPERGELEKARQALRDARDFARGRLAAHRAETEARAQRALHEAGDIEHDLSRRAQEISEQASEKDGALPREIAERIERAASIMREAAKELSEGRGDRAVSLQREAQRLLEQSKTARATERDSDEDSRGEQPARGRPGERTEGGGDVALGGNVPGPDEAARAEAFRRRVLHGLGRERRERLAPAIRRYAEGLLE